MLQYLLNTTAIWLISLVMFDLFLRKESYHSYNRFYLVFTLLLGALLPLWQWPDDSPVYTNTLGMPLEQVISLKQTIVDSATVPSAKIDWQLYLEYIYLLGVLVSLLLLIAEIVKIVRLFQTGKRSRAGSCIIIETGKNYSPFSLFNMIFVNTRQQYTTEEWDMLMAHEQMHGLLFHFIDMLLVQVARIVFWFHPLVYIYQKKLMMLHEYQADKVSLAKPRFYGQFLVEQAMLQTAPSISHSFNHSPIKNRILMLTRTSSPASRSKMLLFIPLALVCIVFFTKNSFSQKMEKNGNMVTYRGNKFEMSESKYDTFTTIDPVTGKENMITVATDPYPLKMNGIKVYNDDEIKAARIPGPDKAATAKPGIDGNSLREYLLSNLNEEFKSLGDNKYTLQINNVVVDDKGNIVYFEDGGIAIYSEPSYTPTRATVKTDIDPAIKDKFTKKINTLLSDLPSHAPATLAGQAVPFLVDNTITFMNPFTIKGHKLVAE